MKIAFIGSLPAASVLEPEFIRESYRGVSHPAPWIVALLPALAKLSGFKLRVILIQRAVLRHCIVERDGVEYECIPYRFPGRLNVRSFHILQSIMARRALQRFRPDVVHAFGMETGAATIALRSGFPVSCFVQGILEYYYPYLSHRALGEVRIERWCEAQAVRRIKWFVAESEFGKNWVIKNNPSAKVSLIPHPLRMDFLDQAAPAYARQIVSVGGLDDRKGMDTVIKAFAQANVEGGKLCIVGSGPLEMSLHDLVRALNISDRVEFTGALDTQKVIQRLNESSVFVIGARVDTSPNVVSEAHAIGLPVIGTLGGGIPEMIDEGKDGYLVGVDDVDAMSLRMRQLLADPEECRRMGRAGREKVKELNSPDAVAIAHLKFFQAIGRELNR
jgi:glycosyltransferase involved in cell wall biosynthesis